MSKVKPTAKLSLIEPLAERIQILFDELSLAARWQHASILLAVYESEYLRRDVESELKRRLAGLGQRTVPYQVDPSQFDIPLELSRIKDRGRTVYFISGLRWGGGKGGSNAYRALNIRRELLLDHDIRAVFWLTRSEASALPRRAPDFWAFRHRVVEFTDQPESGRRVQALVTAKRKADAHPESPEAWNALGKALFALGRFDEATGAFKRATRLDSGYIQAWQNLAKVSDDAGRTAQADHALRKARRLAQESRH